MTRTLSLAIIILFVGSQASALPLQKSYREAIEKAVVQGATSEGEAYVHRVEAWSRPADVLAGVQACGKQDGAEATRSFTVAGDVEKDGKIGGLQFAPQNAWVSCIVTSISKMRLPQPPVGGADWPISLRFDTESGALLNVSGTSSSLTFPQPPPPPSGLFALYSPRALPARGLIRHEVVLVRLILNADGSVRQVATRDERSSPGAVVALDAARQWVFVVPSPNFPRTVMMNIEVSPTQ